MFTGRAVRRRVRVWAEKSSISDVTACQRRVIKNVRLVYQLSTEGGNMYNVTTHELLVSPSGISELTKRQLRMSI